MAGWGSARTERILGGVGEDGGIGLHMEVHEGDVSAD
jgi:hypothetical protein